ncbi:signal peptidase II [Actinoalloteichus hoggarensis]|uniref:signal peptidase II n=1 Tax=Actinoalloteichus hoggarensis TaxID=1470176 RepID=UPI0017DC6B9C|nr:signal peptidase II [Actinoalloteichus hoggarensis]MBB5919745.1 signal peptidase II [Actinoalloteichus hoggarensis]
MTAAASVPAAETAVRPLRVRLVIAAIAATLAVIDLVVKHLVEQAHPVDADFGLLSIRLAYNPGISFSMGASLPAWVVIAVTGAVTLGIAVYAWRTAPEVPNSARLALAMILAGATGNLVDRIADGAVTDYLYTGWFPTFNIADALLTCGVVLLILVTLLTEVRPRPAARPEPEPQDEPAS